MRRSRQARYERCVLKVKHQDNVNPYAVCHASIKLQPFAKSHSAYAKGYLIEKREHPELSKEVVGKIARDHLKLNPDYYKNE